MKTKAQIVAQLFRIKDKASHCVLWQQGEPKAEERYQATMRRLSPFIKRLRTTRQYVKVQSQRLVADLKLILGDTEVW